MDHEKLIDLIRRLDYYSNSIIACITELLHLVAYSRIRIGADELDAYKAAVHGLERLFKINQMLIRIAEAYLIAENCNSASFRPVFRFDEGSDFEPKKEKTSQAGNSAAAITAAEDNGTVPPDLELQKVEFSAVAPKTLTKGNYSIINVIMYERSFRSVVDDIVKERGEPAQESRSGVHKVKTGSAVKVFLSSPDIAIDDNMETGLWQGGYLNFTFAIFLPEQYKKRQVLLNTEVYINNVIAAKLKFIVKCSSQSEQKISITREDILSAFVSYASQDRQRVAIIIQGMKKARPDMDVFFDVDSLRSGDDWERALRLEIEKRDILFLCWSHFARESKWVDAEWRYALEQKGADCIEPVPIEPPDICPPPKELNHKHFNDKLLYIIDANRETIE